MRKFKDLSVIDYSQYDVSSDGYILENGNKMTMQHNSNGYLQSYFFNTIGRKKPFCISRVIAYVHCERPEHLKGIPYEYLDVDHINGDRTDNRADNLKWCTHKENCNNPSTIVRYKQREKSEETRKKISQSLSSEDRAVIGKKISTILTNRKDLSKKVAKIDPNTNEILAIYPSIGQAARENNISHSAISKCCRGIYEKSKSLKWAYV